MTESTRNAPSVAAIVWRRPRGVASSFELLITHPGAPLFAGQDAGAWFFPTATHAKNSMREGDLIETALQALDEVTGLIVETPAVSLGEAITADGHRLIAFAFEADGELPRGHRPPQLRMEWPPHSGFEVAFEAVDEKIFAAADEAAAKIHATQCIFLERLRDALSSRESAP